MVTVEQCQCPDGFAGLSCEVSTAVLENSYLEFNNILHFVLTTLSCGINASLIIEPLFVTSHLTSI